MRVSLVLASIVFGILLAPVTSGQSGVMEQDQVSDQPKAAEISPPKGIRLIWDAPLKDAPVPQERQLIEWRMSGQDVEKVLGKDCYVREWAGEKLCILSTPDYGGWYADFGDEYRGAFSVFLYFFDGQFFRVFIKVRPEHFQLVENTLIKALSKPSSAESSVIKNRMGAEFDQETRIWEFPEVSVQLLKRAAYVDEGLLSITYKPIASLTKKKEEAAQTPF